MIRKNWKGFMTNKPVLGLITAALMIGCFLTQGSVSRADSTGTVIVESAKVRQEASTTSEVVGSAAKDAKVTIKEEVKDSSGTLWYKITVEGDTTGYVRSDLVQKEGGDTETAQADSPDTQTTAAETTTADNAPGGATASAETPMDKQYATVSVQAAKIRTAPSTNDAVVESLAQGTQMVVSGQTNGSDGKVWYYVTFTGSNGAEKTGFVRSDLISLGEMLPVEEPVEEPEQPQEEPQETEEPVNNDYEVRYTTDDTGNYYWYLYDNVDGTRQKLEEVLAAAHAQSQNEETNADLVVKQRVVIIVMAAVIVLFIITVIVLSIKLRNSYYYEEYEDEEEDEGEEDEGEEEDKLPEEYEKSDRKADRRARREEREYEEEEEPQPSRARRGEDEKPLRNRRSEEERPVRGRREEEERPVREDVQERPSKNRKAGRKAPVQEVTYEEEPQNVAPVKAPAKKKAKNFLLDDDDFEFEFLNMDDKDL